eukprot:TRINITY_DN4751_c0_g1_i1.p2 TRINITY_DN4751_c0_g1~~TRINITY_DN4751_c0_g1_i1.p2  ORF type:complete len:265 (-),score=33.54 TRINITY_DN4751_c0_g1_i1:7-801(-)
MRLTDAISAGEPLNPEVIDRVQEAWGCQIRDGYGQTETTALVGSSPGQTVKVASMGRPLPGYDVVLLDPDRREIDPSSTETEGEIAVRLQDAGGNPVVGLMAGYWTETGIRPDEGAYHLTGDVARRDSEGYFFFIGRTDDVFKSADYRISPFELESALLEHPDVAESAVVPQPHAVRLSVPKAYVTLKQGIPSDRQTALSIFRFLRTRLAPYKRIRRLEFCDLPKTVSGKIRRVQLRDREQSQHRGIYETEFREEDFPELRSES